LFSGIAMTVADYPQATARNVRMGTQAARATILREYFPANPHPQ
jgi:hypothetical protein